MGNLGQGERDSGMIPNCDFQRPQYRRGGNRTTQNQK